VACPAGIKHVLLISVDGMHQQDLTWYVDNYPDSTLATLDHEGLEYSDAMTPFPSDSFPGMVGQVTGGNPKTTGIYYDDTWNHDVFPIGTTNCSGPVPGAEVAYTEADDINLNSIDAGQGLRGLPGSILRMTPNPRRVIPGSPKSSASLSTAPSTPAAPARSPSMAVTPCRTATCRSWWCCPARPRAAQSARRSRRPRSHRPS